MSTIYVSPDEINEAMCQASDKIEELEDINADLLAALEAARGHADSIRRHSSNDDTIVEAQYITDNIDTVLDRAGIAKAKNGPK